MRCRGRMLTRRRVPQFGKTLLHWAARNGHSEWVKLLLEAGANITATDKVSERSLGDGGLGIRTRRDFGEG